MQKTFVFTVLIFSFFFFILFYTFLLWWDMPSWPSIKRKHHTYEKKNKISRHRSPFPFRFRLLGHQWSRLWFFFRGFLQSIQMIFDDVRWGARLQNALSQFATTFHNNDDLDDGHYRHYIHQSRNKNKCRARKILHIILYHFRGTDVDGLRGGWV